MTQPASPTSAAVPAAAAKPAAPAPAKQKLRVSRNITPLQGEVNQVMVSDPLSWLAEIDDSAPSGKLAKSIGVQIDPKGNIQLTIRYAA